VGDYVYEHFFSPEMLHAGAVKGLKTRSVSNSCLIVQELCESRGGRPGLSVLTSLLVSVDVKNY